MRAHGWIGWTMVLAAAAGPAAAQYQWRDENGRMTYSDRPPPVSVRAGDVLRRPGGSPAAAPAAQAVAAGGSAVAAGIPGAGGAQAFGGGLAAGPEAGAGLTAARAGTPAQPPAAALHERELQFRKRRLERAQAERQQADQRAQAERLAQACEDSRAARRALQSGMRMSRVSEGGEREFLSDEARARKLAALQRDVEEQCRGG